MAFFVPSAHVQVEVYPTVIQAGSRLIQYPSGEYACRSLMVSSSCPFLCSARPNRKIEEVFSYHSFLPLYRFPLKVESYGDCTMTPESRCLWRRTLRLRGGDTWKGIFTVNHIPKQTTRYEFYQCHIRRANWSFTKLYYYII